jgi:MFS family permease
MSGLPNRERRLLARQVQVEAGAWGILKTLNDAFINPLLISRGAGPLALGLYNSGANLFGFGAGWLGPRLAARTGSVRKTALASLVCGRAVFFLLALYILLFKDASASTIIPLVIAWGFCEGLVLPLWASFIAGMVGSGERGRWLAMRATAATMSTVPVMLGVVLLFLFASKEEALPLAYLTASVAGIASLVMVARLFRGVGEGPIPPVRSVRSLPSEPGARRFLGGVLTFWFGSAFIWPVMPAYILNDLNAPPVYFAFTNLGAAIVGAFIQRRWGRLGDHRGATRVLLLSSVGAAFVPLIWTVVPAYYIGFFVEIIGWVCWPGHMLGLTLRSVELAERDSDRSALLGWTNLAQGTGACISPLIASALVIHTGTIPILLLSASLRITGALVMASSARQASAVSTVSTA